MQLFNSIRAKAANNSYRRRFEGGLPAGDCIGVSIPVAAPGYQDAGANAASVLSTVGNDRFRAAFFLGQTDLVSLQPCLEQGGEDNVYEREAAAKATEVSGFSDAVSA
ncbi:hypothetical protein MKQ70_33975 [Chitinophaga sedimenti]|uniref:hypothetical protein n=1 Tax=Chitinophaga sedimenti TaxID=2033606 RepID=UPI002005E398|nr:hypothetical protein [Chitinophaga sedimenti]MCK7559686.1 hypothetical protein [Chitinophaga sedimenti]